MNLFFYSSNSVFQNKPVGGAEHSLRSLWLLLNRNKERTTYITDGNERFRLRIKTRTIDGYPVIYLPSINIPLQRFSIVKKFNESLSRLLKVMALEQILAKADLVHTYNECPDTDLIIKVRNHYSLNYKVVIRVAGLYWHEGLGIKSKSLKKNVEDVYNSADSANFISEGLKKEFFRIIKEYNYKINLKHSFVLDIGVPDTTENRRRYSKNPDCFEIIMPARFNVNRQKRQDLLISAFKHLQISNSKLFLYGDGPNRANLEEQCYSDFFFERKSCF